MAALLDDVQPLQFPELVGMDGEEAKAKILEQHPTLNVVVRPWRQHRPGEGMARPYTARLLGGC
jgi:hypothetical protein